MSKWRKIFLVVGIEALVFFLGSALCLASMGASLQWLLIGSLGFTAYIVGIALFVVGVLYLMNRRAYSQKMKVGETGNVHQKRTIEIDVPKAAAFDLCLEALNTLHNIPYPLPESMWFTRWLMSLAQGRILMRLKETDFSTGEIEARLRGKSFGFVKEFWDSFIINFRIEEIDATTSRIHIESRPRVPTVVFDFGMDLHFVNQLALFLRQESQREAEPDEEAVLQDTKALRQAK